MLLLLENVILSCDFLILLNFRLLVFLLFHIETFNTELTTFYTFFGYYLSFLHQTVHQHPLLLVWNTYHRIYFTGGFIWKCLCLLVSFLEYTCALCVILSRQLFPLSTLLLIFHCLLVSNAAVEKFTLSPPFVRNLYFLSSCF